jgi:hypothetical protein
MIRRVSRRDYAKAMITLDAGRLMPVRGGTGKHIHEIESTRLPAAPGESSLRIRLEGLASKHRDRPYRGGRQKHSIKVKNRKHPAMDRVAESFR